MSRLEEKIDKLIELLELMLNPEKDLTETDLRDSHGKVNISPVIQRMVKYDPATGKSSKLSEGVQLSDNNVWTGTNQFNAKLSMSSADMRIGLNNKLIFDDNETTYFFSDANGRLKFIAGNVFMFQVFNSLMEHVKPVQYSQWAKFNGTAYHQVLAADPGAIANNAQIFAKDVGGKAHMFAMDEDGNTFDLTV